MDVTSYVVCALVAGAAGGAAGWCTVRRMLGDRYGPGGRGPRPGTTMRGWPGPGSRHGADEVGPRRRLGRARRAGRRHR